MKELSATILTCALMTVSLLASPALAETRPNHAMRTGMTTHCGHETSPDGGELPSTSNCLTHCLNAAELPSHENSGLDESSTQLNCLAAGETGAACFAYESCGERASPEYGARDGTSELLTVQKKE